jgi:hypothetical protein
MVPFAPILQDGEEPFAMFVDLQNKYHWVLKPGPRKFAARRSEPLEQRGGR